MNRIRKDASLSENIFKLYRCCGRARAYPSLPRQYRLLGAYGDDECAPHQRRRLPRAPAVQMSPLRKRIDRFIRRIARATRPPTRARILSAASATEFLGIENTLEAPRAAATMPNMMAEARKRRKRNSCRSAWGAAARAMMNPVDQ